MPELFPDGVMVTHRFLVPLFQVRVLVGELEILSECWGFFAFELFASRENIQLFLHACNDQLQRVNGGNQGIQCASEVHTVRDDGSFYNGVPVYDGITRSVNFESVGTLRIRCSVTDGKKENQRFDKTLY